MVSDYSDAGQVSCLASKGIDLIRGLGRITGPGKVAVDGRAYSTEHIVVSTGSSPLIPPVPGLDVAEGVWTNREATGLKQVPRHLLVLGGGPVGVEMAQAIRRMGAQVTLVEGQDHVLPREPKALGDALGRALLAEGVDVRFGQHASAVRRENGDYVVEFPDASHIRGDKLLVATGRRPRVDDIGLETVGVTPDEHGVPVDGRMRAAERVWAIGDATGIWPLTHVGKYQARVAAANILGRRIEAHYGAVPGVVFTDPQAASVGASDGPLKVSVELSGVARTATYTRAYAERPGFLTLISDGKKLTGAYAVGPEAGEWLQQATLAIRAEVPLDVLHDTIQPFPTFSEVYLHALAGLAAEEQR